MDANGKKVGTLESKVGQYTIYNKNKRTCDIGKTKKYFYADFYKNYFKDVNL